MTYRIYRSKRSNFDVFENLILIFETVIPLDASTGTSNAYFPYFFQSTISNELLVSIDHEACAGNFSFIKHFKRIIIQNIEFLFLNNFLL